MSTPTTTVDTRFSQPGATGTSWDETRRVLAEAELAWITTVRADGRPHVTPLVAVWVDDALHFCTGITEQKSLNLQRNPNVILLTGCNHWNRGVDVVVEGRAVRVTDRVTLERLAKSWRDKWDGRWEYEVTDDGFAGEGTEPVSVFSVRPKKVLAFAKDPFSHTRHTFEA